MKTASHYRNARRGNTLDSGEVAAYYPGKLTKLDEGTKFLLDGVEQMVKTVVAYYPGKGTIVKY